MPDNNYNYGSDYIMKSDKTSVDEHPETNLTRQGKEFSPEIQRESIIEAYPKKQSKSTVEASLWAMADQKEYYHGN